MLLLHLFARLHASAYVYYLVSEWRRVEDAFEQSRQFPGAIGASDGKQISN